MSTLSPQTKLPRLIFVIAFDRDDEGELFTVFDPQDYPTEDRAVRTARSLAAKHVGVIAWSREANVDFDEYGAPTVLFQSGDVPDMEQDRAARASARPGSKLELIPKCDRAAVDRHDQPDDAKGLP